MWTIKQNEFVSKAAAEVALRDLSKYTGRVVTWSANGAVRFGDRRSCQYASTADMDWILGEQSKADSEGSILYLWKFLSNNDPWHRKQFAKAYHSTSNLDTAMGAFCKTWTSGEVRDSLFALAKDVGDMSVSIGNGVIPVCTDLCLGVERTAEGFGLNGTGRMANIGSENAYLAHHLVCLVKSGVNICTNPLFSLILTILSRNYEHIPDEVIEKIAKTVLKGAGYMAGRMVIGKEIAKAIALKLASRVAASTAYRQLAVKLGVSSGASATGVGVLITLTMFQGVAQRASKASLRLQVRNHYLWSELRNVNGLDMLYFLVEEPLAKYMDAIDLAHRNKCQFEEMIRSQYR